MDLSWLGALEAKSLYPPFGFMALYEWYFEMHRDDARSRLGGDVGTARELLSMRSE